MIWSLLFCLVAFAGAEDFFADLDAFESNSLSLRTERERLDATSARLTARWMQFTPEVSLGASKQKSSLNGNRLPETSALRASASWNLFRTGADLLRAQGAGRFEEAQGLQVESEALNVELKASRLLFANLYLRDTALAQGELLKLKEEGLRIGRERYQQGKIPLQEVAKIEVDLSQQRNRLRLAELERERNLTALRSLFVDSFRTIDWPFAGEKSPSLGVADSPALRSLVLRAEGAEKSWQAARLLHGPSLDLNFNYQQFPLSSREQRQWSGSLDLTFPLWSQYSVAAASAEAHSAAAEARWNAETRIREEKLERGFLAKRLEVSRANLEESRRNLEKSERLYRDMLRSFQLGRLSTNDLFIEQNRKIESVLSLSASRQAFHESLMEACALWGLKARDCLR